MPIVTIWSRKGGTGKSSLTAALGSQEVLGSNRLLVDADSSCDLTLICGEQNDQSHGFLQALTGKIELKDCIVRPTSLCGAYLVRGENKLDTFDSRWAKLNSSMGAEFALRRILDPIRQNATVLVDAEPGFGITARLALYASDFVLIPVLPELLSVHGLRTALSNIAAVRQGDPEEGLSATNANLKTLGVILAKVPGLKTRIHKAVLEKLSAFCADSGIYLFNTIIPERTSVQQAQAEGKIGNITGIYKELANELNNILSREVAHG